ncbi:SDR family oxidoreductase [Chitinolyticbacter albus]|uniref:SDR family oxidoreductase n=1 Tax=Chitinolyticbacter albus TaxID=2961951 RepID=UPI00210F033E|nr:SDR family oxidoreductase [Chitinolyticbacter albus]
MSSFRILLLGADGFIGRHLAAELEARGHTVVGGVRQPRNASDIAVDFSVDHDVATWLARVRGFDVVINAVGVFRSGPRAGFDAIHETAPRALYAACHEAGVRRVLLISVLGAATDGATAYWRSKAAGEAVLRAAGVPWTIVQPGLVYGADGASSRLFARLGSLPLQLLPASGDVQPIHVDDLATGCARLIDAADAAGKTFIATGPQKQSFALYLRRLGDRDRVCSLQLPARLGSMLAILLERLPGSLISRDSLTMLAQGSHGDGNAFAAYVGRPLCAPPGEIDPAGRLALQCWQVAWLLRGGLAFVWLATAWVSLFVYPVAGSHQLLAGCGIPAALFEPLRVGSALLDAGFGVLTLLRPGRRLWQLQLALIAGYSTIVAFCLPEYLAHPFGPLTKNAGLIAALAALIVLEEKP